MSEASEGAVSSSWIAGVYSSRSVRSFSSGEYVPPVVDCLTLGNCPTDGTPYCGDGILDTGELCDDGLDNTNRPNANCRPDCSPARCGDGITDTPLETCDDANNRNEDGCSSMCRVERTAPTVNPTLPAQVIELPFQTPVSSRPSLVAYDPTLPISPDNMPPVTPDTAPDTPVPPSNTDSGPAALLVIISGAAAGYGLVRRRSL